MLPYPHLTRCEYNGISYYRDPALDECGVALCFTERDGGVSEPPYETLNLGSHVGDRPDHVAENRRRVMAALTHSSAQGDQGADMSMDAHSPSSSLLPQVEELASALCVPNQTHGEHIVQVEVDTQSSELSDDLAATDSLIVTAPNKPIMLCFADCVPVILVAPNTAHSSKSDSHGDVAVAIAHAGWKGALASLPGKTATKLAEVAHCDPGEINAYIGAHIRDCCYETSEEILDCFVEKFGEGCRAATGDTATHNLSLSHAVRTSLTQAGIDPARIAELTECTSCNSDRFFSYRADGPTSGRHCAAAFIYQRR